MFRILCILLLSLFTNPSFATPVVATLTAEQAASELRLLQRALTELHPGLYRYITAEKLDAEFARAAIDVANGIDAPPPENQEFGLRDFRVRDCDGNQLNIATRL